LVAQQGVVVGDRGAAAAGAAQRVGEDRPAERLAELRHRGRAAALVAAGDDDAAARAVDRDRLRWKRSPTARRPAARRSRAATARRARAARAAGSSDGPDPGAPRWP